MRLGDILDHGEVVGFGNLHDFPHFAGLASDMGNENRSGPRCDGLKDGFGRHIKTIGSGIGEYWDGKGEKNGGYSSWIGDGWADHLASWF